MSGGNPAQGREPAMTAGHLFALIRSRPVWTRQELLAATGMSRPTLLARLAPLLSAGLAYESGSAASTGGRPAQLVRFDDRHMVVLTIDIGHTHATVAVVDVHGRELRSARHAIDVFRDEPADVLNPLMAQGELMIAATGRTRLVGIGMSLPSPIWPGTGLPHRIWTMPRWRNYPLRERIGATFDAPLILENDARAMALGETTEHDTTLLAVKWANGIGAGLVVDGRCLAGDDGAAGDIGHIRVGTSARRCRCGRRGCLAAYASGYALVRALRLNSVDDLVLRATSGDTRALDALTDAAELVGGVLASLIAMLNPGTLVLNGAIGRLPEVIAQVDKSMRGVALSRSTENLEVIPSRLGEHAATVGLARLVANRVLHPDAIDEALAG